MERHKFSIPGIVFTLFVGGVAAREQDAGALNSTQGKFVWLADWANDSLCRVFGRLVAGVLRHRGKAVYTNRDPAD